MSRNKIIKILILLILILLTIYGIYFMVFQKVNKTKKTLELQLARLNKEIEYVKKDNQDLKKGVYDSSKEEYLEKEARMNLGYKKDGETAVILSGVTTTTKAQNIHSQGLLDIIKMW